MSYFTDGNQTTEQNNQGNTNDNQSEDYVAKVVQSKGDTWANPQVLAKGKLEADTHIQNLEDQLKEMRGELDKQDYAKSLLEQLKEQRQVTPSVGEVPNAGDTNGTGQENTTPKFSEDELKNLINSTLTDREAQSKAEANLEQV